MPDSYFSANLSHLEKSIGSINQIPKKTSKEIILSGKSNVGKSSLINSIISKKIAYTSKNAGKTILINFYSGKNFKIVDVPGYGFSKRSEQEKRRFNKLTDDYFNLKRCDLVLHLIDSRNDLQENDAQMIDFLSVNNIKFYVLLTKVDKMSNLKCEQCTNKLKSQIDEISDKYEEIILVSSKTGVNIKKIRGIILSFAHGR